MTVFIVIAVLITLLALAWLVRPLLRNTQLAGVSSQRLNASIYREQLEALERDLARGVITAADCEATRDELQLRLLDDTEEPAAVVHTSGTTIWSARRTALAIAVTLPLGAAAMYWVLGAPAAMNPATGHTMNDDKVAQMVDALAARLKASPDNPKGWAMLARSYKVMGRFAEAEQAFLQAGDLVNKDPDLLVDYADLLAVVANNTIEGRPLQLVNQALALNPQHPMGLMMSGVAAYRRSEFAFAVKQWEKLLAVLEPGSPDAQQVTADIANARAKAAATGAAAPAPSAAPGAGASTTAAVPATAVPMTPEKINQMIDALAARLKTNPQDLPGWVRLARAYKVQGRLPEAEAAYGKAAPLVDTDPDLLAQYADVLATRSGNLEGRPLALVNKALALNPKHPMALMLAANAAYRRADYAKAVAYWETVLTALPPGSPDATQVQAEIADARSKGGLGLSAKTKP